MKKINRIESTLKLIGDLSKLLTIPVLIAGTATVLLYHPPKRDLSSINVHGVSNEYSLDYISSEIPRDVTDIYIDINNKLHYSETDSTREISGPMRYITREEEGSVIATIHFKKTKSPE